MKEIEVKAKISNFSEIKAKLLQLGCTFSEPLLQKDRIYLPHSIEYPDIKRGTIILRIREAEGIFTFNLKKQVNNELDNIEREMIINDPEQADAIIKDLGFHEVMRVTKKRIKCKYQDLEICLDEVDGLGSFIEVEKLTSEEESLRVQKELFEFLESLGIHKEQRVFKGYDTLLYELKK